MLIYALMFEDAVNAAYAISPEGSILASAQAADALLVGSEVQPDPCTAFPQAMEAQTPKQAHGALAGFGVPTPHASASPAF